MAKTGLEYVVLGDLNEADGTYSNGFYLGPTSTFNGSPATSDVKDYGDDRAVETDNSVTGGTVSVELNEMVNEHYARMLGHEHDKTKDSVKCNANDVAPFLGIGAVGKSKADNRNKYTVKFYHKAQFKEPNDENATKQESVTFAHTTLEGNLFTLENGDWKEVRGFDELDAAKAWLNEKVGITAGGAG